MSKASKERLGKLLELWVQEQQTVHARFVEERQRYSLEERVGRGLALRHLDIVETDAALGGRVLLWIAPAKAQELDDFRAGPGTPVRLWLEHPDGPDAVLGTLSRKRRDRIGVVVDDFPEDLEEGGFHLDRDEPQATFVRGKKALERFIEAEEGSPVGHLREVLLGERPPSMGQGPALSFRDPALNAPQREAIVRALNARDVALIHGPPGTGKTRTLVEVIRQAVARGDAVLATAASNAAVDNLAERLAQTEVQVVRLGHPARVSPQMESHTLDALLEQTEEYALSRRWIIEANDIRRRVRKRRARGEISRSERREMLREMRHLFRDARKQLQGAQDLILSRAQVLCSTAAGADVVAMGERSFDLVVLDEATQATAPIALVPLCRAHKVVMAGDPCQLPPTVIDPKAARDGLAQTLFDRLHQRPGIDVKRLLKIQYRMHEELMRFPSKQMYEGQLEADPSVAAHRLEELPGVSADPLRVGPLLFIDTAGAGWEESRTEDDPSTCNPQQAERTAAEVRRLLSRGLAVEELAVIAPYDAQVRLLRRLLEAERLEGLEIGSIDGFQGREKEAIVLDMVRSNDDGNLGFLNDTRRMNVALTRARRLLLVIGDSATLSHSPFYAAFLDAVDEHGEHRSIWDDEAEPLDAAPLEAQNP